MRSSYRFDTPQPDARTQVRHTPLELTERLALMPPRAFTATVVMRYPTE